MTSGKMISNHSLSVFWLNSLILESPNQPSPLLQESLTTPVYSSLLYMYMYSVYTHVNVQCTCVLHYVNIQWEREGNLEEVHGGKFGGSTWREIWRKYMYVRLQGVFIIIVPAIKGGISIVF